MPSINAPLRQLLIEQMEKTWKEMQSEIVEDISLYDEWLDKYEYLIELGK